MLRHVLDPETGHCLWACPECRETIRLTALSAVRLVGRAGRCQGCRARATLERNPALATFFLDSWARADAWPQSNSWLNAVAVSGIHIGGNAQAGADRLRKVGSSVAGELDLTRQAG